MIRFFIVIFLTLTALLSQERGLFVEETAKIFDFKLSVYEDTSAAMSFEQIRDSKNFTPSHNRISLGYTKSAYWFKFKIKNTSDKKLEYTLLATELIADTLDCYIVSKNAEVMEYKSGLGYINSDGLVLNSMHKFPFSLNAFEEKEIYVRETSLYPLYTSLYIFDKDSLSEYTLSYEKLYSLYFGGIIALILFNLFLYFSTKDRSYFLYVMYVSSFMVWQLSLNGFPPFESYTKVGLAYINGLFVPMFIAFLFLFSREILDMKQVNLKLDKIMKYIAFLFFTLAIFTQIELYSSYIVLNYAATIAFPLLVYFGYRSYLAGNKVAIFYLTAQVFFLLFSTVYSLMTEGYIEYNLFTRHGIVIGSSIEIILFSLALGYRLKLLEDEKMQIINQTNVELDKKVQERTSELEDYQLNLEKKVEQELKKSRDKDKMIFQQNKLVSMGEMIENIAHQWRQPLSQVNSAVFFLDSEISKVEMPNKSIVVEKLDEIERTTHYMSGTIDDFRSFFDRNKEGEEFYVKSSIYNSLSILEGSLLYNNIETELNLDKEIKLDGYINELQQVLLILLNNAKDAFILQKKENAKIIITMKRIEEYVEIKVSDNAGGIEEDILEKIFDAYFTTKLKTQGTGLGLNIAKIIIEEHFLGRLSVQNDKDGVCFTIRLPLIV